jgi:hypothetical protein
VLAYLPNVIVAVLIFVIAAAIAGAAAGLAQRTMGDTATGDLVKTAAPALVLSVAFFMVLTQLKIAPGIVQICLRRSSGRSPRALPWPSGWEAGTSPRASSRRPTSAARSSARRCEPTSRPARNAAAVTSSGRGRRLRVAASAEGQAWAVRRTRRGSGSPA